MRWRTSVQPNYSGEVGLTPILGAVVTAVFTAVWIGYRCSTAHAARATLLSEVTKFSSEVAALREVLRQASADLQRAVAAYVQVHRTRRRGETPVEALKDAGADRVRWGSLHGAGIRTLADLDRWHPSRLLVLQGIGETSAMKIAGAAAAVRSAIDSEPVPLPGTEMVEPQARELVNAAVTAIDLDAALDSPVTSLERRERELRTSAASLARRLGLNAWVVRQVWSSQEVPEIAEAKALAADVREELGNGPVPEAKRAATRLRDRPADLVARYADLNDAVADRIVAAATGTRFARSRPTDDTWDMPSALSAPSSSVNASVRAAADSGARDTWTVDASVGQVAEDAPSYGHPGVVWVPPGEPVTIVGRSIPGGMLYVGCVRHQSVDPSFINPALPVNRAGMDRRGESMTYWPSYSTIAPSCRSAYLAWLSGGRTDPTFGVGYAFLFFYGLEYRLLRERELCAAGEVEAILAEVERLLGLYGGVRSFRRYAGSFLAAMRTTLDTPRLYERPPLDLLGGPGSELEIGLAQAAADGKPLPAAWALAWYLADGMTRVNHTQSRCPEEFARLFALRYRKAHGDGILLGAGRAKRAISYQPASSAFGGQTQIAAVLPAVDRRVVPKQITAIGESCAQDLDGYARGSGRRATNELARIALLPAELLDEESDGRLTWLRDWLDETVPVDAPILVIAKDLLARWVEPIPAKLKKRDVTELAQVLGRLGYAIDPDPRFGGGQILATERIALMRLPVDASSVPSETFPAAALMIRLCAAVACADDEATRGERERVEEIADAMDGLEASERVRLRAQAVRLFETRATLGPIARRVAAFSPAARDRLGTMLVGVAAVDGRLSPKEIAVLTKVFTALGLDPAAVYQQAHARATDTVPADEPVVVRRPNARSGARDYRIEPPTPKRAPAGVQIDERALARKHAETAEVLAMLAPIFADEPSPVAPAPPVPVAAPSDVPGLDARHAALLRRLVERSSWARADVEGVCEDLGLLPDGALEVVNDAAYEHAGGPVVEGEEPLVIDQEAFRSWSR